MKIYFIIGWFIILISCKSPSTSSPQTPVIQENKETKTSMKLDTNELALQLINKSYGGYFYYPTHTNTLNAIFNKTGAVPLQELIKSENQPIFARFIACEVLLKEDLQYVFEVGMKHFAAIYRQALEEDLTGFANSWGLLYDNDDMGPIGNHFRIMGNSGVKELVTLLDNQEIRTNYIGSEEATIGSSYEYRVKDFAAFYLSKIKKIPLKFHKDFKKRDQAIEVLKSQL